MQTKSAKAKGRRLQNWVKALLIGIGNITNTDVRVAIMGESGADVQWLTKVAQEHYPFSVECKNQEGFKNVYKYMDQAKTHNKKLEPLVVIKSNNQKPLVILDAEFFFYRWQKQ